MTEAEAQAVFPFLDRYWRMSGGFFATPVGGESLAQVAERVYHFLRELREEHDGQTVMLVTHGYTTRALHYWLERLSLSDVTDRLPQGPRNCGVTVYERNEKGALALVEYDSVLHAYLTEEGRLSSKLAMATENRSGQRQQ